MKKILYTLLAGALALASCSKQASEELAPQNEARTFTLSVEVRAPTGTIATLAKPTQECPELKFTYAAEGERTESNVPYQQSSKTNVKGEYSNTYTSVFTISNKGGDYVENHNGPLAAPSIKLTVDIRKKPNNASDATLTLPLDTEISGYTLTVDWGDGNIDEFADGKVLDQTNMTHPDVAAGVHTIHSSQEDVARGQKPKLDFGGNYFYQNDNPY